MASPPDVDAWDPWHPQVVAQRLAGVTAPWYVAGGWAIDLFRGEQSREHEDLEIAVPAGRFAEIAERLEDCEFYGVDAGRIVPLDAERMRTSHQTWAMSLATRRWCLDVFREPHDGDVWICRRDEEIRRPYAEIIEHDVERVRLMRLDEAA